MACLVRAPPGPSLISNGQIGSRGIPTSAGVSYERCVHRLQCSASRSRQPSGGAMGEPIPKAMTAVVYQRHGPPREVLEVKQDMATPVPKESEILIKVTAASINPIDYKTMTGAMLPLNKRTFPAIPGTDVSGVIVQLGPQASIFKLGDQVFCDVTPSRSGTLAEYVAVPEAIVSLKPPSVPPEEAVGVPLAGVTVYQALKRTANLQRGQSVLILGGSGGTGTYALQIAKALGAAFVATTSTQAELCKFLGADRVINYRAQDWAEALKDQPLDIILDCVGGRSAWLKGRHKLARGGVYLTLVGDSESGGDPISYSRLAKTVGGLLRRQLQHTFLGGPKYGAVFKSTKDSSDLEALGALVEEGCVRTVVDPSSPYRFETVVEMFEKLASQRSRGKLIFVPK